MFLSSPPSLHPKAHPRNSFMELVMFKFSRIAPLSLILVIVTSSLAWAGGPPRGEVPSARTILHSCRNCDDGNPCTRDVCLGRRCIHIPKPNGSDCELGTCMDGVCHLCLNDNDCQSADPCEVGICDFDQEIEANGCRFIPADNAECTTETGETGRCFNRQCQPEHQEGDWCDDGDPCTKRERWKNGICTPEFILDCNDGNSCTTDICLNDHTYQSCAHRPLNDGQRIAHEGRGIVGACFDGQLMRSCSIDSDCQHMNTMCMQYTCDFHREEGNEHISAGQNYCRAHSLPDGNSCEGGNQCQAGQCLPTHGVHVELDMSTPSGTQAVGVDKEILRFKMWSEEEDYNIEKMDVVIHTVCDFPEGTGISLYEWQGNQKQLTAVSQMGIATYSPMGAEHFQIMQVDGNCVLIDGFPMPREFHLQIDTTHCEAGHHLQADIWSITLENQNSGEEIRLQAVEGPLVKGQTLYFN